MPRARTFLVLLLMLPGILSAMPVQYKIDQMLKQAEQQRSHQYVPARAGWNGSEEPQATTANPAYQKLLYESSPAAIRSWLRKAAWPHWSIPFAIAGLIFALRLARWTPSPQLAARHPARAEVLVITKRPAVPDTSVPTQEAA